MDDHIRIGLAQARDAAALLEIHGAAVHQTAAPYYPEDILHSWSPLPVTGDRIERVQQRWIENPNRRVMVARHHQRVVGYGMVGKEYELLGLYVHPDFGRRGIGARLLAALEQEAATLGLAYLTVDASINAEAFYRKHGFEVIEHGTHQLSSGQEIACIKMRKTLEPE